MPLRRSLMFTTTATVTAVAWYLLAWMYALTLTGASGGGPTLESRWMREVTHVAGAIVDAPDFLWGLDSGSLGIGETSLRFAQWDLVPTVLVLLLMSPITSAATRSVGDRSSATAFVSFGAVVLATAVAYLISIAAQTIDLNLAPVEGEYRLPTDGMITFGLAVALASSGFAIFLDLVVHERAKPATEIQFHTPNSTVATWSVLPMLCIGILGGLSWDYPLEEQYGGNGGAGPGQNAYPGFSLVLRLLGYLRIRPTAPHHPSALVESVATDIWLPRTIASITLIVVLWVAIRWLGHRLDESPTPIGNQLISCWAVVTAASVAVALIEGVVRFHHLSAYELEFGVTTAQRTLDTLRDAACFGAGVGWVSALGMVVARQQLTTSEALVHDQDAQ